MRRQNAKFLRLALPLLATLPFASCTKGPDEPLPIQSAVTLSPFNNCEDLEKYIEDTAVHEMTVQLDGMKQGAWGWGFARGGFAEDGAATPSANAAGSTASAPTAWSTTNVQVKGVDEPDFMKNDGTRIFTLTGRSLHATSSWPPQAMHLGGSLELEGYPSAMFLDDKKNQVVVLSNVYIPYEGTPDGQSGGGAGSPAVCWDIGFGWGCGWGANATKITVVDVAKLDAMKVLGEYWMPGNYSNARRIGSSVRVVLSDTFRWPVGIKWWPESNDPNLWSDAGKLSDALDALKGDNEKLIRAATLDQWLPSGKYAVDGKTVTLGYDCHDFNAANAPVRLGLVTVATLDLDHPGTPPARTSIVAEPGEIYASQSSLYLASWHWWWWPKIGQQDWFYVHKFDITDPTRAKYVASGGVEGRIVDQFSMDEWKGDLRIGTTLSWRVEDAWSPFTTPNPWGHIETTNRVEVLSEKNGQLVVVGRTAEMAPGERIFSTRFVEDKGYVVTFRQVDPLFTVDLSAPASPRVVGSLKVEGFSNYIQPLDATHLLTIGVYTPDPNGGTTNWNERRMQLQVFDVSDFANPKQLYKQLIGSAYGWSEALYEHKAFNWFPERKLLAIPFSDYQQGNGNYWDNFVSDVRVFSVDVDKGITPLGSLTMKDVYVKYDVYDWQWWYSPWIRRSVMSTDDQNNDFVYAVADGGLRVANLKSLDTPLATVLLPPPKRN